MKRKYLEIGKYSIKRSFIAVILCLIVVSMAFATVLYTLTVPMQFRVSLALGLELWDSTKTNKITLVTWSDFVRGETKVQTFYIKNTGNKDANCTLVLGSYQTSAWLITHTFANQTVLKNGFSEVFTISIKEIDAISDGYYTCDLAFKIVDHFNVAYEQPKIRFEASSIAYLGNTSQYLQFVSESFNHANPYNVSESVTWQFVTKNPNPDYILQSYSYQLDLYNSSGFIKQLFLEGSASMLNLHKDQTHTITKTFTAPSFNGTYWLKLTYVSHNSQVIPPPIILTWVCEGYAQTNCHIDTVYLDANAQNPNTNTIVHFDFWHEINIGVWKIQVNVKIWDSTKTTLISQPYTNYWIEFAGFIQKNVREHLTLSFTTPSTSTSKTYIIEITEIQIGT
jgi:hypothetical protein